MARRIPSVAIVGRANVGKSSLFNAISGRKKAVVDDIPGVTRDRNYALVTRFGFPFTLIDTGGLLGEEEEEIYPGVREQVEMAMSEADILLAVFDGAFGLHPNDSVVADLLRKGEKPVIWTCNKCEKEITRHTAGEFYSLGMEEIFTVSAAHNIGIAAVVEKIRLFAEELGLCGAPSKGGDDPIKIAIVGKPNTGKSTLINRLCGSKRVVTSPLAGTTVDTIEIPLKRNGRAYTVIDTAGLRKKSKVAPSGMERFGNLRALRALAMCDVAVLVIDATDGAPTEQDAKIAGLIHERGRAVVIAVNKWDAIEKDHKTVKEYEKRIRESLKFFGYAPIVFISALTGRRCPKIIEEAQKVFDESQKRIQTAKLNRTLSRAFDRKPPPIYRGSPVKLFFATQTDIQPPQFVLFVDHPDKIHFSYVRYLKNVIRKEYGFKGVDIKLVLKKRRESPSG